MKESARNRFWNRFQNQTVTRSGTTDQNQNQNQTVVKAVGGWFVAKKSSIATAVVERPGSDKRMGDYVALSRGVR